MAAKTGLFGMGTGGTLAIAVAGVTGLIVFGPRVYDIVLPALPGAVAPDLSAPEQTVVQDDPAKSGEDVQVSADAAPEPVQPGSNDDGLVEAGARPDRTVADAAEDHTDALTDDTVTDVAPPELAAPAVDVVRIDPDGSGLIAGSAPQGSEVTSYVDDSLLETVSADGGGKFAMFVDLGPSDQPRLLTLAARRDGQETWAEDSLIIAPTPKPQPPMAEATPEPAPEPAPQPAADTPADIVVAEADVAPDPTPDLAPDPAPDATPEPVADAVAERASETTAEPAPKPASATRSVAQALPEAAPEATPEPTTDPVAAQAQDPAETPSDRAPSAMSAAPDGAATPSDGTTPEAPTALGDAPVALAAVPDDLAVDPAASAGADTAADDTTAPRPDRAASPASPEPPTAPDQPGEEPRDFAAPRPTPAPGPVAVLRAGADGVELLQPGTPQRPEALDSLSLDTISYSEDGEVLLAGRAPSGAAVRVYLDNVAVKDLTIDPDGRWKGEVTGVRPGIYTLRLDQVAGDGSVDGRLETPFKREAPAILAAARDDLPAGAPSIAAVTVQRGDTLWAISQDRYGSGFLYVRVFEANRDSIRDPDLIYPGQVFSVPN